MTTSASAPPRMASIISSCDSRNSRKPKYFSSASWGDIGLRDSILDRRRVAFEIFHSRKPENTGEKHHRGDDEKRDVHIGVAGDETDQNEGGGIAQSVNDQNVQGE